MRPPRVPPIPLAPHAPPSPHEPHVRPQSRKEEADAEEGEGEEAGAAGAAGAAEEVAETKAGNFPWSGSEREYTYEELLGEASEGGGGARTRYSPNTEQLQTMAHDG
jgi:hypothetical protein